MIWLTWRQHRGEAIGIGAVVSVFAALALITGLPMHDAYTRDGVASCRALTGPSAACKHTIDTFLDNHSAIPAGSSGFVNFLPLIAGILIGAPFLAREYEHGTWQLAWTQAVPRTRWLAGKLAGVLAAAIVSAIALSAILGWWLSPLIPSAFSEERFNYAAPVLSGYVVLAIAIGILAGAVIQRAIPAMVVTLAVFLPIRLVAEYTLRPNYMTPITAIDPEAGSRALLHRLDNDNTWILDTHLVDRAGNRLSDAEEFNLLGGGRIDEAAAAELGLRQAVTYHPAARFWEFQLIETAIFGGLALVLLVLVIWQIRRS